jgi:hypothetical protein
VAELQLVRPQQIIRRKPILQPVDDVPGLKITGRAPFLFFQSRDPE